MLVCGLIGRSVTGLLLQFGIDTIDKQEVVAVQWFDDYVSFC